MNKEEAPSFRIIHRSEPEDPHLPDRHRDLLRAAVLQEDRLRIQGLPQELILTETIPTETARILLRRRVAIRKER